MKKILYIFGFLMLATIVVCPLIAQGQDEQFSGKEEDLPYSSARIFSKLVAATGLNPNADWSDTFSATNEEDIGKNLYLMIYSKTEDQPQKQAHKNVAAKYGMTEADLVRILHSDYSPIIAKKPTLTQEEAQRKISEIQQEHKEEKELLNLEANVKAAVEPTEIFANGDLGDSGFDLINDLQIIEKILFLKSDPIDVGKTYEGKPLTISAGASASAQVSATTAPGGFQPSSTPVQSQTGDQQQMQDGTEPAEPGAATPSSIPPLEGFQLGEEEFNPNSCFATGEYEKAFEDFLKNAQQDKTYVNQSGSSQLPGSGFEGQKEQLKDGQPKTDGEIAVPVFQDFFPQIPAPPTAPVEPAPADKWLKDPLCPGPLCLDVQFIKKPATSAYQNSDNCIACHVEKTNDVLKQVIDHTLVPSKAPGNLAEPAQCKDAMGTAFTSVSMNIYVVPMPVKTPLNDDLIYETTIEDEWQTFCNTVSFFPFDECKKPENKDQGVKYEIPPSLVDTVSKKELSNASPETTSTTVAGNIDIAVNGYVIQRDEELAQRNSSAKSDKEVLFFHPLKTELDTMNLYFSNIRDILQSLHEKIDAIPGSQACTELNNKKECK